MDDSQRIVKCGHLSLHSPGGFFKKRWHDKYLVLYDGSKSGVKRLELFESEIKFKKQSAVKIIPLVDCVRIVTCQRHKSTFTFEVRTSDQFYLLASKSFQDTNDWVNCLRLVAFGQQQQQQNVNGTTAAAAATTQRVASAPNGPQACLAAAVGKRGATVASPTSQKPLDALLERRPLATSPGVVSSSSGGQIVAAALNSTARASDQVPVAQQPAPAVLTASQAAAAAANALAKTRQRQPSLLGSCKPQPPTDSPFIAPTRPAALAALELACGPQPQVDVPQERVPHHLRAIQSVSQPGNLNKLGQVDTLTPTVRGQLIGGGAGKLQPINGDHSQLISSMPRQKAPTINNNAGKLQIQPTLDEEEENMLYCSIEDNPSEHNYRVKVIETDLALRCQLKCYQLTAPKTISQQYEELSQFRQLQAGGGQQTTFAQNQTPPAPQQQQQQATSTSSNHLTLEARDQMTPIVTFYQLIIGPQELTLLNDYATTSATLRSQKQQQQGLWSWPYQCIRRYGFDKDNCFMFEAGRKCTSGPGQFVVQTPKAYNIYQDVVKFVNELRTIGGGGAAALGSSLGTSTPALAPASLHTDQQLATSGCVQVTQIPVTWTPASAANEQPQQAAAAAVPSGEKPLTQALEVASGTAKCRRQFFNQLSRQADSASEAGEPAEELQKQDEVPATKADLPEQGRGTKGGAIRSTSHDRLRSEGHCDGENLSPGHKSAGKCNSNHGHSSGSEETDESGYEQGDESVESRPARHPKDQPTATTADSSRHLEAPARNRASGGGSGGSKLTVQATRGGGNSSLSSMSPVSSATSCFTPNSSSPPSSSAPSSANASATNSPGQSVSRRTGESIQQQAKQEKGDSGAANQLLIDTRRSLNKVAKQVDAEAPLPPPLSSKPINGSRALHDIIASDVLGAASTLNQQQQQSIDFETSLIRDVYSEITKLHAKFAVTSTGSNGEDSMSSDSRESSAAISDRISHGENELDQEDDDDDDEDEEEESDCADDGCYYMNEDSISDDQEQEPMYSNLRPINQRTNSNTGQRRQTGLLEASSRLQHHHHQQQQQTINNKPQPQARPVEQQQFRRAPQPVHHGPRTNPNALANNNNNYSDYNPQAAPLSPQSMRPIYPTILNPIPEINESPAQNHSPRPTNATGQLRRNSSHNHRDNDLSQDALQGHDFSARARLALNRDAVIKRQQQPVTTSTTPTTTTATSTTKSNHGQRPNGRTPQRGALGDKSKPTNHYVINDVQYAKISRNLAPAAKFR